MLNETTTQRQVRLVLETQCRKLADDLRAKVPAGVGFLLFLADYGDAGNLAYVSSCKRDDAIRLVQEWLDTQDANHPAEGWETAAQFLLEVARATGFPGEPEPAALLEHCRMLAKGQKP